MPKLENMMSGLRAEQARIARSIDHANSVRDVAGIFGTSERTVWRLIRDGKLKAERLGARCVRVFDSEIARYRDSLREAA